MCIENPEKVNIKSKIVYKVLLHTQGTFLTDVYEQPIQEGVWNKANPDGDFLDCDLIHKGMLSCFETLEDAKVWACHFKINDEIWECEAKNIKFKGTQCGRHAEKLSMYLAKEIKPIKRIME